MIIFEQVGVSYKLNLVYNEEGVRRTDDRRRLKGRLGLLAKWIRLKKELMCLVVLFCEF